MLGLLRDDGPPGAAAADRSPQPGLARLPALLDTIRGAGLAVDLHEEGEAGRLPPGEDLSAYRIVQESLTNTLKHARAQRARVTLRWNDDAVEVEVVDDGAGGGALDMPSGGRGLIGMRERAAMFGGTLTAAPLRDGGFRVHAVLPRPQRAP
jgi:signal transduction histidine kinase